MFFLKKIHSFKLRSLHNCPLYFIKPFHDIKEDSLDKKFMKWDETLLLVSESSCWQFFKRQLKICRKDDSTKVRMTVKCLLCGDHIQIRNILFMYVHLYEYHVYNFVQSMFLLEASMDLPNCDFSSSTMHMCYYHNVPCNLNEVLRITVISHCIATLRVQEKFKVLSYQLITERSELFSSNTDMNNLILKIRELIPEFPLLA